jgi:hypothetical protein
MTHRPSCGAVAAFWLLSIVGCGEHEQSRNPVKDRGDAVCRPVSPPDDELLIDDFEDGDAKLASVGILQGTWYVNNDGTGTQKPDPNDEDASSSLVTTDTDVEPPTRALHTSGAGFSLWGAFAAAHLNGTGSSACSVDLSGHRRLSLRVKGEGSLRVNLGTKATTPIVDGGNCATDACSDYGVSVQLSSEWRDVAVSFADLTQPDWADAAELAPAEALRLSFWSERSSFDFWVDDIRFSP